MFKILNSIYLNRKIPIVYQKLKFNRMSSHFCLLNLAIPPETQSSTGSGHTLYPEIKNSLYPGFGKKSLLLCLPIPSS